TGTKCQSLSWCLLLAFEFIGVGCLLALLRFKAPVLGKSVAQKNVIEVLRRRQLVVAVSLQELMGGRKRPACDEVRSLAAREVLPDLIVQLRRQRPHLLPAHSLQVDLIHIRFSLWISTALP